MTNEMKMKLFEKLLEIEKLAEVKTHDNRDYAEQADGAFQMLDILGLGAEYIKWSCGK